MAVLLAGTVVASLFALARSASSVECQEVPDPVTGFDPVMVCIEPGDRASGTVAVSAQGDADASGPLEAAAVSGTGNAENSIVCASATGFAGGPHGPQEEGECAASASAAGSDGRWSNGQHRPASSGAFVSVSGTGSAQAPVAVSGTGDSKAQLVSVSGTGHAGGDTYTGDHPAPYIAASGCTAEHATHTTGNNQIASVDPGHVHVWVDLSSLGVDDSEPFDHDTGAAGDAVQSLTCAP